ncbi:TIGR02300 family protein [Gluconacetobacter tumulisoli]|uniref:TIGR02300 family protein n=1 Tax=Gluconacetobacter tumulisoli TaxID=1286189 RepID=A0A7W4K4B9_9PROT|nr:TIGR02300 family protein [Gluconacetobacter tumulisoli]MBB2200149.1 TIGR02300 family protein [Gluconacetobacter tumulisoli]
MAQPNLGTKRVCVSCSARFYDLNKNPVVCPKCGTEQPADVPRIRRAPDAAAVAPVKPKDDDADTAVDLDADDADGEDDVMEDTSDLDDDDDEISADIDVSTDNDENDN